MKPTDKEKQEILRRMEKALDQGDPFMILLESSPEAAVMMGGDKESISRMLSIAMSKIPELEIVVKYARKALKHARKSKDKGSMFDAELIKCETCDKRDDCDIRPLKEKAIKEGVGPEDLLDLLKTLVGKHMVESVKSKGDC